MIFYSLGFGMLAVITRFPLFIVSTFLWTLGEITIMTKHQGRFNAIMHLITGTGFITGPLISGFLVQRLGVVNIWPIIGIPGIVVSFLFYLLFFMKRDLAATRRGRDK